MVRAAREVHMSVLNLREGCGGKRTSVSMKNRFPFLSLRVVETRPAEELRDRKSKGLCLAQGTVRPLFQASVLLSGAF